MYALAPLIAVLICAGAVVVFLCRAEAKRRYCDLDEKEKYLMNLCAELHLLLTGIYEKVKESETEFRVIEEKRLTESSLPAIPETGKKLSGKPPSAAKSYIQDYPDPAAGLKEKLLSPNSAAKTYAHTRLPANAVFLAKRIAATR